MKAAKQKKFQVVDMPSHLDETPRTADEKAALEAWLARTETILADDAATQAQRKETELHLDTLRTQAMNGDKAALRMIYDTAEAAARALENLRNSHPQMIVEFAQGRMNWPVGFAAFQSIGAVKNSYTTLVKELQLGTKIDSVYDFQSALRKFKDQNAVRAFVIKTLNRIESIRRRTRKGMRAGWYETLRAGGTIFPNVVATNADPVAKLRVALALALPRLRKSSDSCDRWISAVQELIIAESDGNPECHPLFRPCGEPGAKSKATSYQGGNKASGKLRKKSYEANIRFEIMRQVKSFVRYLAPDVPTEIIGDYLPPKSFAKFKESGWPDL